MQYNRSTMEQRISDLSKRDIPSFIEPRPPLVSNPFMRPKPWKGTNWLQLFEEDSELEEPELVQVYLRMKPCDTPSNLYEVRSDKCLITSTDTATAGHGRRTQHNVSKMYTFTKIFGPDTSQKAIFENIVKENLQKLPQGHNYTLLTYGASGSGKTFTLMGTVSSPGLVPRSLEYLFKIVDAAQQPLYRPSEGGAEKLGHTEQEHELQWVKKLRHISAPLRDKYRRMSTQLSGDFNSTDNLANRTRYYVWVSFVEIYNEAVFDLLVTGDRRSGSKLRIREDSSGSVYVQGATQAFVRSGSEAYDVLVAGKHNLQVAATGVHAHSSRSHCIFTISMLTETESGARVSSVRLCDLAGSERAVRTRNTGARMQESRAINSSLHVLERCLHMLRQKQKQGNMSANLVPYRESKLTRLLGAGLSGARGEAVSMLVTVNPEPGCAHETRHVLQLAAVARDIQVNATIAETSLYSSVQDTTVGSNADVMKLRVENERLLFELLQAQARYKELLSSIEANQQKAASTQRELVDEARHITRQYYEAQLRALEQRHRDEIEDLTEEYESKLHASSPSANKGTPTRNLQNTITQLRTDITIVEEKLNLERLAREMAEAEVQHLRACIEERDHEKFNDDKSPEEDKAEVLLTEGKYESDDELNQSLEPSFRVDKANTTVTADTSMDDKTNCENEEASVIYLTLENTKTSSLQMKSSNDSIVDDDDGNDYDNANDSTASNKVDVTNKSPLKETYAESIRKDSFENGTNYETRTERLKKLLDSKRGTYVVSDVTLNDTNDSGCNTSKSNRESDLEAETVNVSFEGKVVGKSKGLLNRLKERSGTSETSLELFEKLEKEAENIDSSYQKELQEDIIVQMDTEKSKKQSNESDNSLAMFEQLEKKLKEKESNNLNSNELKNTCNVESEPTECVETEEISKINDKIVTQESCIPKSAKKTILNKLQTLSNDSDKSLAVFEQFEKDFESKDSCKHKTISDDLINVKIFKEKRTYFENAVEENNGELQKETIKDISVTQEETKIINDQKNNSAELINVKILKEKRIYFQDVTEENTTRQVQIENDVTVTNDQSSFELINTNLLEGKRTFFDNLGTNENLMDTEQCDSVKLEDKELSDKEPKLGNKCYFSDDESSDLKTEPITGAMTDDSVEIKTIVKKITEKLVNKDLPEVYSNLKILKGKPVYFDNIDQNIEPANSKILEIANNSASQVIIRSPSIVKEEVPTEYEPSTIKKLLDDSRTSNANILSAKKSKLVEKMHDSLDMFDEALPDTAENVLQESMKRISLVLECKVNDEQNLKEEELSKIKNPQDFNIKPVVKVSEILENTKVDNTADEFENLYKDVTSSRVTEFELLVTQELNNTDLLAEDKKHEIVLSTMDKSNTKYNLQYHNQPQTENKVTDESKSDEIAIKSKTNDEPKHVKYNLRHRIHTESDDKQEETEKSSKSTIKSKRSLRLRRRKNLPVDDDESMEKPTEKLKDIANLQKEFSDVIMDIPVAHKTVKDIESPDKEAENLEPMDGIQSCSSKSVTRSRRKLFTPRAEPLEESPSQAGDSGEPVRVPRPSYHRARARRKL